MATPHWRNYPVAIGLASLLALCAWSAWPTQGSPPTFVQDKGEPKPTRMYYGVLACSNAGCHSNPGNPNQKDVLLCDYDEVRIWTKEDKHKDANTVLKGERGLQMAKLLGIKGDISKEPSCVSCHGVLVDDPKLVHKPSFSLEEGVSCGVCHGMNKEWVARHSDFLERETWRGLKREDKEKHYGMTDLWDPEKRAVLCASCHIGNSKERKVVTHTMYAAGHPPLPGFELATFSEAMPKHWKYLSDKSAKVQQILNYDPAKVGLERTQLVVVAALVSFRESLNLLASQAEEGADAKDPDKSWPEFAQFDCYACHHDLQAKSWRQKRGYTGKPGRPDMRAWPTTLVPLGILHTSKGLPDEQKKLTDELHDKLKELTAAFNAKPFGDPKLVAQAARQTADWANGVLKKIKKEPIDRPAANKLLLALGKESKHRLLDFDSARQLTWAFRSIQNELDPKFATMPQPAKWLTELEEQLKLDLPKKEVAISKDYLKDALEKLNGFEPDRFKQRFERLMLDVEKKKQ